MISSNKKKIYIYIYIYQYKILYFSNKGSLILYIKFAIAVNEFFLNEDSVISNVFILPLNIVKV